MDEIRKPEISKRFDVDDIRKIRDFNSHRHAQMSCTEIINDFRKSAEEIIKKYDLNVSYAQKLR